MNSNIKRIIQKFDDGSYLEFDQGQFDQWCIYLETSKKERYDNWCVQSMNRFAPKDEKYFDSISKYAKVHSKNKVYSDFVKIYDCTQSTIETDVLELISKISKNYGNDSTEIEILFCILYAGMVAEENKQYSVLGKRVKRLGIHQLLIDEKPLCAKDAANFSRGKKVHRFVGDVIPLNIECKNRGF